MPVFGRLLGPVAALIERGPGELLHHYMETGRRLGQPDFALLHQVD